MPRVIRHRWRNRIGGPLRGLSWRWGAIRSGRFGSDLAQLIEPGEGARYASPGEDGFCGEPIDAWHPREGAGGCRVEIDQEALTLVHLLAPRIDVLLAQGLGPNGRVDGDRERNVFLDGVR